MELQLLLVNTNNKVKILSYDVLAILVFEEIKKRNIKET